jgi:hypothetical protein
MPIGRDVLIVSASRWRGRKLPHGANHELLIAWPRKPAAPLEAAGSLDSQMRSRIQRPGHDAHHEDLWNMPAVFLLLLLVLPFSEWLLRASGV